MTDYHLYVVTVGCPACDQVTQFLAAREKPVSIDSDVPIDEDHCPHCGFSIYEAGEEWDRRAEQEVYAESGGDS